MISRHYRFHGYNSLRRVYQHGQSVRSDTLSLRFLANPKRKTFRAAIVVSRKVNKSAVVRNRIRRRLYELLRSHQDHISQPHDIVLTVFSDQIANMPHDELEQILGELLTKARLISPTSTSRRDIVNAKEI